MVGVNNCSVYARFKSDLSDLTVMRSSICNFVHGMECIMNLLLSHSEVSVEYDLGVPCRRIVTILALRDGRLVGLDENWIVLLSISFLLVVFLSCHCCCVCAGNVEVVGRRLVV